MVGRPTDYDPSYCDRVVEWGAQGKSLAWMAAELDCCKQTLHNWMAAHPEFLDAMMRARAKAQQWWEDAGQNNLLTPTFNASAWSKSMAARFPDDWRDKNETAITGAGGGSLTVAFVHADPVPGQA